ncbi:hypothetical protein HYS48_03445 [Candidatus Woesearchaeota archaeon]|nr:hypothetical protein [Candidatus Woesearchaeota archaeon]
MLSLSILLNHYKRKDIQEALVEHAQQREVAVKYGEEFGKRPDTLQYANDVLELAKQGATSFHASEERWRNPLQLDPEMRKADLDKLRIGWDVVLDIDSPFFEYNQRTAHLLVKAIEAYGVSCSIKYSGNRGFHIGIPFETFPERMHNQEMKLLFPEGPRKVAAFLQHRIQERLAKEILALDTIQKIVEKTGKPFGELVQGNKFNPFAIIHLDTVLISSRHLYRMPYCFHEKSGLVSIPIDTKKVLEFQKETAKPEQVVVDEKFAFLFRVSNTAAAAKSLLIDAFDFTTKLEQEEWKKEQQDFHRKFQTLQQAVPEQFFPPCIQLGLKGLADGRKRFIFILINFLSSLGWSYADIEKKLLEWNKKNPEPLRETVLVGQLRYHQQQQKKILPPNCQNLAYYVDIGICKPDNLCRMIKNPVSYARRKSYFLQEEEGGKGKKRNESREQKITK